jgi:hypothetical protein
MNPIKSFTDSSGTNWWYYDGSFWAIGTYNSKRYIMACPAMADGTPEISIDGVNACDVSECEQHHVDFVNEIFGCNFILTDIHEPSGIGCPVYRK